MSAAREAAARRGRLREFLSTKTQADATPTQNEILQQLGADVSLRTLKRDLRVLRGKCKKSGTKGTHTKRSRVVNHSDKGSNNTMKKIQQIEDRLAVIEHVQLRVIDFLDKQMDVFADLRKNDLALLAITNQAAANHAALREKCEQMNEIFTAAVRAADHGQHTNH